jgi:radical SAM protein with 4Fe4S-binding SPASM domain
VFALLESLKRLWLKHTRYRNFQYPSNMAEPELFAKIELTDYCNQKCICCPAWHRSDRKFRKNMSLSDFEIIAGKLFQHVHYLQIGSAFEPMLNPEMIGIIKSLSKQDLPNCSITTNGTTLDRETAEIIIQSGAVHALSISLDGLTRETYRKMRGRDDLDKVLAGIERLVRAREHGDGGLKIHITTLLANSNIDEALDIARFAADLGIDIVQFIHVGPMEAANPESLVHRRGRYDEVHDALDEFSRRVDTFIALSGRITGSGSAELTDDLEAAAAEEHRYCLCPWYAIYVDARGGVQPCVTLRDRSPMGNIIDQDMDAALNSIPMMELRKRISNNQASSDCRRCLENNPFSMWGIEPLRYEPRLSSLHGPGPAGVEAPR